MVFVSLLVFFLSGVGSAWAEFSSAVADKLWATAVKPSLPELQSSNWMQVGGA